MAAAVQIVTPAPYLEAAALYRAGAPLKPDQAHAVALQLARAKTYGLYVDGRLAVVIGYWPHAPGVEEMFCIGLPAAEIAPHLLALVRHGQLTMLDRVHSGVVGFRALVRHGHRPGERLARLCGLLFPPSRDGDAPAGFNLWTLAVPAPEPSDG